MEKMSELQKKEDLVTLMSAIIENSTAVPFRWHCSKFACFFCCFPFEESSKLKSHYYEEHSDAKIRNTFRSVIKNSKVKLEISNLTCKKCSKSFTVLNDFMDHLVKIHSLKLNLEMKHQIFAYKLSDENMQCLQCGDEFRFFGTLLKHTHAKHNTTNEAFLCEICGQAFVTKTSVASHVKSVHSQDNATCDKCNIAFKNANALQLHHRRTHRTYMLKCPKCPEVLTSPYLRKRHLAKVHDVKRFQYECDLCNFVFTLKSRLISHKSRVHMKERSYSCEFCAYKAFNKESLTRHMVSHDDSRPYPCEFCKKAFQRKKTLELHRRIHTNDRRYICRECNKAFVQYTSLKLHYRVHHSKEPSGLEGQWPRH